MCCVTVICTHNFQFLEAYCDSQQTQFTHQRHQCKANVTILFCSWRICQIEGGTLVLMKKMVRNQKFQMDGVTILFQMIFSREGRK